MLNLKGSRAARADAASRFAALTLAAAVACAILTSAIALAWLRAVSPVGQGPDDFWKVALSMSIAAPAWTSAILAGGTSARVRELARSRDEYFKLALLDPLTGLFNRRGFDLAAAAAAERARRASAPVAALMCDIDWFKAINDRHGHLFGDHAIREIADVARAALGDRDAVIGRWGGEEFLVVLPGVTIDAADKIARGLRAACAAHRIERDGLAAYVTVSIGVAADATGRAEFGALLARADAALFQAKTEGRNRVVAARSPPSAQTSNARARRSSS